MATQAIEQMLQDITNLKHEDFKIVRSILADYSEVELEQLLIQTYKVLAIAKREFKNR
jgi:hypothetical protein